MKRGAHKPMTLTPCTPQVFRNLLTRALAGNRDVLPFRACFESTSGRFSNVMEPCGEVIVRLGAPGSQLPLSLKGAALKALVDKVAFAARLEEESRYSISSIRASLTKGGVLGVEATDGVRLARAEMALGESVREDLSCLFPAGGWKLIRGSLKDFVGFNLWGEDVLLLSLKGLEIELRKVGDKPWPDTQWSSTCPRATQGKPELILTCRSDLLKAECKTAAKRMSPDGYPQPYMVLPFDLENESKSAGGDPGEIHLNAQMLGQWVTTLKPDPFLSGKERKSAEFNGLPMVDVSMWSPQQPVLFTAPGQSYLQSSVRT